MSCIVTVLFSFISGNLFATVLNPTPGTPLILSETSPQIDFAKQKLSGEIPNLSLTSIDVTSFFQVGE